MHLRIGFLASHNGSNVEAILKNIRSGKLEADPRIVITNNPNAGIIDVAKRYDVPSICLNDNKHSPYSSLDDAILETLIESDVNIVILAGYMKLLGTKVINNYKNKVLNIHPALLPKYGGQGMYGMKVHEAVIASDDTESGATVHIVDPEYDHGKTLKQQIVPRLLHDTAETLATRVLEAEHQLYSDVLKEIGEGRINM